MARWHCCLRARQPENEPVVTPAPRFVPRATCGARCESGEFAVEVSERPGAILREQRGVIDVDAAVGVGREQAVSGATRGGALEEQAPGAVYADPQVLFVRELGKRYEIETLDEARSRLL